jgi:2-hydroxychromene-2-carboxylate isomerase
MAEQPLSIDVFWSFRSPWSYLATPRLLDWSERYALDVRFRPVYPIAVRTPEFFEAVHPQWFRYFMTDVFRVAEYLELPFKWPNPDPIVSRIGPNGRPDIAREQPYIHRLTRLGILAAEEGAGIRFANEVAGMIWGGTQQWHEGDHLARAAERAGLDLAALDRRAVDEADRIEQVIAANEAAHADAGHWGVPTCAFRGEPFFGQDRLDVLLWRLRQHGLSGR